MIDNSDGIQFDPTNDVFRDIENLLNLPLENKTPDGSDECRHLKVYLDEQNRTVTCQQCEKALDAFWYLSLLAREWRHRRYQDAEAIKAWRALEQQSKNARMRGCYFSRPPKGDAQYCWDSYEALHSRAPECVFYRGEWYARHEYIEESLHYILSQLKA